MIPRIRDVSPVLPLRACFFAFVLTLTSFASASLAAPWQQSQDANVKPSPAPVAQQTQAANSQQSSQSAQAGSQPQANPLKKAVDEKKVITEDDLARPRKRISLSDLESGEENNPTCDLSCEDQLRQEFGYGPEREAEFQTLLTLTRHEIADDKNWNSRLQEALQAAGSYCDIQRQKEAILGKGNTPQYVRENVNERFGARERAFVLQHRNASGYMKQHIETVRRYSPFRATVMEYQWSEATERICGEYTLP